MVDILTHLDSLEILVSSLKSILCLFCGPSSHSLLSLVSFLSHKPGFSIYFDRKQMSQKGRSNPKVLHQVQINSESLESAFLLSSTLFNQINCSPCPLRVSVSLCHIKYNHACLLHVSDTLSLTSIPAKLGVSPNIIALPIIQHFIFSKHFPTIN